MVNKKKLKKNLKKFGRGIAKGYKATVRTTAKYAPKAERYFGQVSSNIQSGLAPSPTGHNVDFSIRQPGRMYDPFAQTKSKARVKRIPPKGKKRVFTGLGYVEVF